MRANASKALSKTFVLQSRIDLPQKQELSEENLSQKLQKTGLFIWLTWNLLRH